MSQSQSRLVTDCPKYFHCVLHCWEYFILSSKKIFQCITPYLLSAAMIWPLLISHLEPQTYLIFSHLLLSSPITFPVLLDVWVWCLKWGGERWGVRVSWLLSCRRESGEDRGVTGHWTDWLTDCRDFHSFLVPHSLPIFTKIRQTPATPVFSHNLTSDNRDIDILQTCNLKDKF